MSRLPAAASSGATSAFSFCQLFQDFIGENPERDEETAYCWGAIVVTFTADFIMMKSAEQFGTNCTLSNCTLLSSNCIHKAGHAMGAQHSAELLVETEGLFIRHSYSRAFLSALAYSICWQVLRTTPVQTTMAWTTMRSIARCDVFFIHVATHFGIRGSEYPLPLPSNPTTPLRLLYMYTTSFSAFDTYSAHVYI